MREPLAGITIRLNGTLMPGSTTLNAVGGKVLVCATALPDQALSLTSAYVVSFHGAVAVTHLKIIADEETFAQDAIGPGQLHATVAGACLLDHAATLRDLLADGTSATTSVDVDLDTLERAAEAWGPPPPPG
jgi:hypothetical protein